MALEDDTDSESTSRKPDDPLSIEVGALESILGTKRSGRKSKSKTRITSIQQAPSGDLFSKPPFIYNQKRKR